MLLRPKLDAEFIMPPKVPFGAQVLFQKLKNSYHHMCINYLALNKFNV